MHLWTLKKAGRTVVVTHYHGRTSSHHIPSPPPPVLLLNRIYPEHGDSTYMRNVGNIAQSDTNLRSDINNLPP
jgi:hypothetical protein